MTTIIYKCVINMTKYRPISFLGFCVKYIYCALFTGQLKEIKGKWNNLPDSDEYYVYFIRGTEQLPHSISHMLTHNKPSFLWVNRNRFIDSKYIPEHVDYLTASHIPAFPAQIALRRLIKAFKRKLKTNPDAMMHIYTDKIMAHYILIKQKIPTANYTLKKYTQGLALIPQLTQVMSCRENFDKEVIMMAKSSERRYSFRDPILSGGERMYGYIALTVVYENWEYLCPNTRFIQEYSSELTEEYNKMRIKKESHDDIIHNLSPEQRDTLFKLVGLPKEDYDNLFQNTDKLCLIIVGTISTDSVDLEENIKAVAENYSDKYRLFFKPHPTHISPGYKNIADREKKVTSDNGITMLPADLPMEFLLTLYPQLHVGGYLSGVFFSVMGERAKFLFVKKELFSNAKLSDTTDRGSGSLHLYKYYNWFYSKGAWPELKFIWKGEIQ